LLRHHGCFRLFCDPGRPVRYIKPTDPFDILLSIKLTIMAFIAGVRRARFRRSAAVMSTTRKVKNVDDYRHCSL
jgi:hypothetical protein